MLGQGQQVLRFVIGVGVVLLVYRHACMYPCCDNGCSMSASSDTSFHVVGSKVQHLLTQAEMFRCHVVAFLHKHSLLAHVCL